MRIEYELTPGDLIAVGLRWSERSATVRRQTLNSRIVLIAVVWGVFSIGAVVTGRRMAFAVLTPMALLGATIIWVLLPIANRDVRRRFFRQYYRTAEGQRLLGPRQLELSESGITYISSDVESLIRWHAVTGLTVANERCFIAIPGGELAIPMRDLSEQERQEFLQEMVRVGTMPKARYWRLRAKRYRPRSSRTRARVAACTSGGRNMSMSPPKRPIWRINDPLKCENSTCAIKNTVSTSGSRL